LERSFGRAGKIGESSQLCLRSKPKFFRETSEATASNGGYARQWSREQFNAQRLSQQRGRVMDGDEA